MKKIDPSDWGPASVPLSQCVIANGFAFVSGQVPRGEDGAPFLGEFEHEISSAFDSLETVLLAAGSDLSKVVKVTAFLSNSQLFAEFNRIYARRLDHRPARTTVVVAFGNPNVRVEIDAIALVTDEP